MSISENAVTIRDGLTALKSKMTDNLTEKGVTPDETSLNTLADNILDVPAGGGGWQPSDWPDIKAILQADTTPGYGGKYIQLITDHYDTTTLTVSANVLAYRTSDGAFYTATTTHMWDKELDIPGERGGNTRWVIGYTPEVSAPVLPDNVLWVVLDLMLSIPGAQTQNKRLLRRFEFLGEKNISPTLTNIVNLFGGCYSLTHIPEKLDFSKVVSMSSAFNNCYSLMHVPSVLDLSSATEVGYVFQGCLWVKSFKIYGLKVSANISATTFFTHDDLLYTLQNLQTVTGQTLTLGATNLAKLSTEERAIATGKGWTLN